MRLAPALVLVALTALAEPRVPNRNCDIASRRSDRGGVACITGPSYALFEFAPSDGAGMGTACACTTPTGAKGEALTFTRASTAFCTKGNETSGIAAGDLVECASGQPRVMPGGDGTGGLGLSVWEARTNSALRSQEFDNAAWTKDGTLVAAPVVTADQAVSPDGTTTADRVQFPSCATAASYSLLYQNTAVNDAMSSVYARAVTGTPSISVCQFNHPTTPACIVCALNASTWTRCTGPTPAVAGAYPVIGCNNNPGTYPGAADTGAADVYLWGAQHEAGTTVSPYIKTAGTAATRVVERAVATISVGPPFSLAASVLFTSTATGATNIVGTDSTTIYRSSDTVVGFIIGASGPTSTVPSMGTTTHRASMSDSPGTRTAFWDGVAVNAPAATLAAAQTFLCIGSGSSGCTTPSNGTIKRVCLDSDSARCR